METLHQLIVRKMIETVGNYTRVSIDADSFSKVRGVKPTLPYTTMGTVDGHGVRVFQFGDVQLMSVYHKEDQKTLFFMKTKDAQKLLSSVEDERAAEAKLPFAVSSFESLQTQTA